VSLPRILYLTQKPFLAKVVWENVNLDEGRRPCLGASMGREHGTAQDGPQNQTESKQAIESKVVELETEENPNRL
jgi:hypothetical protein